jgi:serine-type D-Ala-D-Ala carboxypeptidase (penicillin-binding protein 5/6)
VSTRGSTSRARVALLGGVAIVAVVAVLLALGAFVVPASVLASGLDDPIIIAAPSSEAPPTTPRVTAKGAILVDADTGKVLYSRNADKELEMASTTKIMTAILILESMPLDEKVKVPAAATGAAGSTLGLKRGETFTVEQLLYAMLVPSANDAAITLGVAEAGSVKAFVAKMNDRAQQMGLTHTHFVNNCGLHAENHYSSARDLAVLASYAMKDPVFRRIVATRQYTLPHAGGVANRVITTSNELLRDYDWVNGIKTGSTPYAGYCLVSSATKDGLTLVSVVLGAKNEDTRELESKALLQYGFDRCKMTHLVDDGAVIADVPVADPLGRQVRLVTGSSFARRLLGEDQVTGQVKLDGDLTLPVQAGQELGRLELFQGDADLGSVTLVAAQSVEPATLKMILDNLDGPWAADLGLTRFLRARAAA